MRRTEPNNTNFKIYDDYSGLEPEIQKLLKKASQQTKFAYAPYSNFLVGAALLLENGKMIGGCNQENVSYPLCICAERVALYTYGAKKQTSKIKAIAITANNLSKSLTEPCMPCGACRQVIQEYEMRQDSPMDIYATAEGIDKVIHVPGIGWILPSAFDKSALL